jgi:hypothetical protein
VTTTLRHSRSGRETGTSLRHPRAKRHDVALGHDDPAARIRADDPAVHRSVTAATVGRALIREPVVALGRSAAVAARLTTGSSIPHLMVEPGRPTDGSGQPLGRRSVFSG